MVFCSCTFFFLEIVLLGALVKPAIFWFQGHFLTALTLFRFYLVSRFWYCHVSKRSIINYVKTWKNDKESRIFCDISPEVDLSVLAGLGGGAVSVRCCCCPWDWALVPCCMNVLLMWWKQCCPALVKSSIFLWAAGREYFDHHIRAWVLLNIT